MTDPKDTAGPSTLVDADAIRVLVDADAIRVLVDAGFLAASRNLSEQAVRIFEAVLVARPALSAGFIGLAFSHLGAGRPDLALAALKKAPVGPETDLFTGIVLLKSGDVARGAKLLKHVEKYSTEPSQVEIARTFLAELDGGA